MEEDKGTESEQIDDNAPQLPSSHSQKRYRKLSPILCRVLCYNLGSLYFGYSLVYFNAIKYEKIHDIFNIDLDEGVGEGLLNQMAVELLSIL